MSCFKIFIDSDTLFTITSLKNAVTDVVINNATITVELFKKGDSAQIGDDIEMTATGSDGDYWCILPNENSLDPNDNYYLIVTIVTTHTVVKKINLISIWSS